jgi:hypothetical protein
MAQMPPLPHSYPDQPFDISESRVVAYIMEYPDLHQYLFNRATGTDRIKYDKETGRWTGVDYVPVKAPESAAVPDVLEVE